MQIQRQTQTTVSDEIEISEITLLSVNEAKALSREIPKTHSLWWLRSPGDDPGTAAYVSGIGEVRTKGGYVNCIYGLGVRPALRISNFGSSNLNVGEKFSASGETWTVISKDLALCDRFVGYTEFRADYSATDANVYEQSDIKKWLENWALEKGIYTTAQLEQMQGRA